MGLGRLLDKAITTAFPGWGLRRAAARARAEFIQQNFRNATYSAASKNRLTNAWTSTTVGPNALVDDSATLNARARMTYRDDWAAKSLADGYRRHVVGIGITPRSAARDPQTGKEDDRFRTFNRRIDRLYDYWARRPRLCDVERTKCKAEMDGLVVQELAIVGEAFGVLVTVQRANAVGLAVQMFEPEQLDWTITENRDTGNRVYGGVEIDADGAPVAYWVYSGDHPYDQYNAGSTRIDASRVMHVFRQDRVRATHGATWMHAILEDIYQRRGYRMAEAFAKRMEACIGVQVRYDQWYGGSGSGGNWGGAAPSGDDRTDAKGNAEIIVEPGMNPDLGHGRYLEVLNPQRPGSQYDPYMKRTADEIAAGGGLDGAHLTRSFHEGNFSSQRQGALEVDRQCDPIVHNLMVNLWCRPIREAFKVRAVLQGLVEAPGFFESTDLMMAYLDDDWQGPPKPWVDPKNQATATRMALEDGVTNLREVKNTVGGDWREALDQRGDEKEYAEGRHVAPKWMKGEQAAVAVPAGGDDEDEES